jgi:hypothetical protein
MVDQIARTQICDAIDGYLDDRLSAFAFDEQLNAIRSTTQDSTAQSVIGQLWYVYDDCDDHLVCLDKSTWDTIQRLKLVLQSGTEVHTERYSVWHVSQLIAAACLAAIAFYCWIDLKIWPLPVLTGGLVSIALAKWRLRVHKVGEVPDPWRAWPFSSPSAIARALGRTRGFRKQRHRPEVAERQIGPASEGRAHWFHFLYTWCLFSPVPLLMQCLPVSITRVAAVDDSRQLIDAA